MLEYEDMAEHVLYYEVDQSSNTSIRWAVASAALEIGSITAFINCADVLIRRRAVFDYDPSYVRDEWKYNMVSNHYFFRAIIRGMIPRGRGYYVDVVTDLAWLGRRHWYKIGS
jgi:NAD(P)-dependent dehydrogenase (short-subunit alcohol dehydrogenase family)